MIPVQEFLASTNGTFYHRGVLIFHRELLPGSYVNPRIHASLSCPDFYGLSVVLSANNFGFIDVDRSQEPTPLESSIGRIIRSCESKPTTPDILKKYYLAFTFEDNTELCIYGDFRLLKSVKPPFIALHGCAFLNLFPTDNTFFLKGHSISIMVQRIPDAPTSIEHYSFTFNDKPEPVFYGLSRIVI